ncbi:MAG TPA: class I tRNA ligase family protein, partial [Candidatus Tripitaka californicus]
MTSELPTKYNPGEVEDKWYRLWEGKGYFHSEPDPQKKSFTIVIPPPNITGVLHMGHALNSILQDVLIRWRRMQGYNTLWMPGTDHAGIATQNVVERELLQKGLRRQDLGRDKF